MDARRVLAVMLSALPVMGLGVRAAAAEDCFGAGDSCRDAAKATIDFKIARDCSVLFSIKPARRSEFTKIIDILGHRPMAGIDPEQFSETPQGMAAGQCERVADNMRFGTPDQRDALNYLVLRPGPTHRPRASR